MSEPILEDPVTSVSLSTRTWKQQSVLESVPLARENPGQWVRVPETVRHTSGWQHIVNQLRSGELTNDPEGVWETTTRTVDFDEDEVRLIALYIKYVGDDQ
jgi:hypothetical protein